jgi:acetoin utilization deacetylase AcuC-like enzyme
MSLPVVHHPAYRAPMPPGHRFPMAKYGRLITHLLENDVVTPAQLHRPELAPVAWLEQAHTPAYVDAALGLQLEPAAQRRIGLPITAEVVRRSRAASAGTLLTARLALQHGLACNSAGGSHHAFADHGAGFCVYNDVAVAAAVLLDEGRIARALVVDLDVHQGDGTAAIFAGDCRVHTFSMHCAINFPLHKQNSDLDIALDAGLEDDAYLALLANHLPGLLEEVRPDLVFFKRGRRSASGRPAGSPCAHRARSLAAWRRHPGGGCDRRRLCPRPGTTGAAALHPAPRGKRTLSLPLGEEGTVR